MVITKHGKETTYADWYYGLALGIADTRNNMNLNSHSGEVM